MDAIPAALRRTRLGLRVTDGLPRLVTGVLDTNDEVPHRSSEVHGLGRDVHSRIGEVESFVNEVPDVTCEVPDLADEAPDRADEVRGLVLSGDGIVIDGITPADASPWLSVWSGQDAWSWATRRASP